LEGSKDNVVDESPAFLLNSERRYPDGNEAVLAEGQAKFGVTGDIEKESAVAAGMSELGTGRAAKRNAAQDEGPDIEGELLIAILPLLANECH
jgi:hypothetical protein